MSAHFGTVSPVKDDDLGAKPAEEPGTEGELNTTRSTVVDQVVRPEENEEAKKWLASMDVAEEEDVIEDPLDKA